MHRGCAQRKSVAWLAVLAMCLLLFAPSISRVIPGDTSPMGMDSSCHEPMHGASHSSNDHHRDAMDACGYCALASHGTVLRDTVVFSVPPMPAAPALVQQGGQSIVVTAVQRRLARGPPATV